MMNGKLVSVNSSPGGIPKLPLPEATVTEAGVSGDGHALHRPNPLRAICIFSEELYAELRSEGIAVKTGDFGENFTTEGVDLGSLGPGDRLRVGPEVVVEITAVRVPCATLTPLDARLPQAIEGRSGWMARVVEGGIVRPGQEITVTQRVTGST